MPIQERKLATVRRQRRASNVRFVQVEQKGFTSDFDNLIELKSAAELNSHQIPDPYNYVMTTFKPVAGLNPIQPLYSFFTLSALIQKSNILRQCIESYVINIESYGHTLEYVGPEGKEQDKDVQLEKQRLEGFLSACSPTSTFRELREKSRWDLETTGCRFFEISRALSGEVIMMDHAPAVTMFRTRRETEPVEVEIEVPNPADPSKTVKATATRNFCRFVQVSMGPMGWNRVYFKEFGDPRPISPKTGEVDYGLSIEEQATEILMLTIYTPGQVYGLPRWIGQLPSILGTRESEMVNLNFFRENAIPAMAVLISGGALTSESFQVIEDYITALRGQKAMQRILVLEASADDTSGSTDHQVPAPRIDMKPMISERQQDGLFKDYDQANQQKVRSSFRLPPIYVGRAEDYTRASAVASMQTAELQIFAPERQGFDDTMNNRILKTYRPKYWRFKSQGAPLVDPDVLSKMLKTLNEAGALTPNAVIKIAKKVLDIQIDPIHEDWGDYPFPAVMAYIEQGVEVPGLTKFIADLKMLKDKAKPPPAPVVAGGKKPGVPIKKPNGANGKAGPSVTKADVIKLIRQEFEDLADEMQDAIVASVQSTAREPQIVQ